jgi:voltage-gated potassium channel
MQARLKRPTFAAHLEELASRPRRHAAIHWAAFVLSLVSVVILAIWGLGSGGSIPGAIVLLDIGLCIVFFIEFFTRSGFRWHKAMYVFTRFFDFIAMVPALLLIHHGFTPGGVLVWLIFIARLARAIDRLLGDGFIRRNAFALADGLEEEITDRVLIRITVRIQQDLDRGHFGHAVAEALGHNKTSVLQRVRAAHPHEGVGAGIAHITGLDVALERAEERTYDAVVEIMNSPEVDKAIRDVVDSTFSGLQEQVGVKSWRKHLGIRR